MRSAYKIRLRDYEEDAKGYEDAKGCVGAELTSWILKGLKLKIIKSDCKIRLTKQMLLCLVKALKLLLGAFAARSASAFTARRFSRLSFAS